MSSAQDTASTLQVALQSHQRGDLGRAEQLYREVLRFDPDNPDALHLLGVISYQNGQKEAAVDLISRAISINPGIEDFHNNLGLVLRDSGKPEAAAASFRTALRLNPANPRGHNHLGLALQDSGHLGEAISCFRDALRLNPEYHAARSNLGAALQERGLFSDAVSCSREVIRAQPDYAEAHNNLACALQRMGRLEEALLSCHTAIRLKPGLAESHNNLGNVLQEMGMMDEAVASYREALRLKPAYFKAHISLGNALREQGRASEARAQLAKAVSLKPDSVIARWMDCIVQIPLFYETDTEIHESRIRYRRALEQLTASVALDTTEAVASAAEAVGSAQPFYLAFQGQADTELQALYGALASRIQAARHPRYAGKPPMPPFGKERRIRVGVVSAFFHHHSNWRAPIKGWIERLDKSRFTLFGYYTGKRKDGETERARRLLSRFTEDVHSLEELCGRIRGARLHVLIYPEVGMDPVSARMAALRLAPIQCTSWGHPDTSGLPTMDYYISSDLMEPPDAQAHYTEQLVRLPNLSIHYTPLEISPPPLSRSQLGIREGAILYSCAHSVLTYLPEFDRTLTRIAAEVQNCQFAFLSYWKSAEITERFRCRLKRAFAREGLRSEDHIVILPHLKPAEFQAFHRLADVYLDSFSWSGCNTTLEAVSWNLPIVTLPGKLMRGRHSYAVLKMMGLTETIATSADHYTQLAVRLGRDAEFRRQVADHIAGAKHLIYGDMECIRGLEQFLERAVEQA